jgi:DNA-binding response OmpR family regulator
MGDIGIKGEGMIRRGEGTPRQDVILVIDDDETIRESVREILELSGLKALTAADGLEALSVLETHTPDLILADIMMPRMNGYQMYQRIRRNPAWLWIPIIFLSAKSEREDIRFAKELGAEDYLTKPIDPAELIAAVSGRLERFRHLSQATGLRPSPRPLGGVFALDVLEVDLSKRTAVVAGQEVQLSPTEFHILEQLILSGSAVVPYGELLRGDEGALDERDAASLVRYHIRNLRAKLRTAGLEADLIVNVRETGYRLLEPPQPR